jgi:AcrR family transcriptional regulator
MVKKHKKRSRKDVAGATRRGAFELLWLAPHRGKGGKRGPKPALSTDKLIQAALSIMDTGGLDALTMAGVAERVGVTTMALYRHVPGKQELMELVSDQAFGEPPAQAGGGWRNEIANWARAYLALLLDRPWLNQAVERRTTVGPNSVAWLNAAIGSLAGSGLPPGDTIAAVLLVDGHVRSTAQLLSGAPATPQWAQNFGRVLELVMADGRYPALTRLVQTGAFAPAENGSPIPFEFGLQRVLDGLEANIPQRSMP